MKIAAVQSDIAWVDPTANFERFSSAIGEAAAAGSDLVVIPETFATGFGFGTDGFPVDDYDGPSADFLGTEARRRGIWVAGSCAERGADTGELPYNSFVFAAPDGERYRYCKIHPFSFGGEDQHVRPGTELLSLDVRGARVTPLVCYDLRFVPEFWTTAPHTDVYVVTANWPAARREHWRTLLRARAIENLAYVVGVNRIGAGGGLDYAGDSMIIAPDGTIIADAGDAATIITAEIDPREVREVRDRFGFLNDRRFGASQNADGSTVRPANQ